ncbi:MAG: DUF6455 family protein [Gemmobacter sp.]
MIGVPEAPRAWWLAQGMARSAGVKLAHAVVEGWITRRELASMMDRCERCPRTEDCLAWLAQPRHEPPPEFCGLRSDLNQLSPLT